VQIAFAPHGFHGAAPQNTGDGSPATFGAGQETLGSVLDSAGVLTLFVAKNDSTAPTLFKSVSLSTQLAAVGGGGGGGSAATAASTIRHLAWLRSYAAPPGEQGLRLVFVCIVSEPDCAVDMVVEFSVHTGSTSAAAGAGAGAGAGAVPAWGVESVLKTPLSGKALRLQPDDGSPYGVRFSTEIYIEDVIASHAHSLEALACVRPMAFLSGVHCVLPLPP
jgi:hypothetical protein